MVQGRFRCVDQSDPRAHLERGQSRRPHRSVQDVNDRIHERGGFRTRIIWFIYPVERVLRRFARLFLGRSEGVNTVFIRVPYCSTPMYRDERVKTTVENQYKAY